MTHEELKQDYLNRRHECTWVMYGTHSFNRDTVIHDGSCWNSQFDPRYNRPYHAPDCANCRYQRKVINK